MKPRLLLTWFSIAFCLSILFPVVAENRSATEIQADITKTTEEIATLEQQRTELATSITTNQSDLSTKTEQYHALEEQMNVKIVQRTDLQTQYENSVTQVIDYSDNGILAEIYDNLNYGNRPPMPNESQKIGETHVNDINFQWGGGRVLDSKYDRVSVKFTGTITSPITHDYVFYAPGDDGVKLYMNDQLIINDWFDKGGGGSTSQPFHMEANIPYTFTLWFYENGGGANVWLYWDWNLVPKSAFSTQTITYTSDETLLPLISALNTEIDTLQAQFVAIGIETNNLQTTLTNLYQQQRTVDEQLAAKQSELQSFIDELNAIPKETVQPSPITPVEPSVEPTIEPTIEPTPTPVIEPTIEPSPEPSILPSNEPTIEPIQTPTETPKEPVIEQEKPVTISEVELPSLSVAEVGKVAEATAKFVKELFTSPSQAVKQIGLIGRSMTEKEREEARKAVVPAVLVGNVLSVATSTFRKV